VALLQKSTGEEVGTRTSLDANQAGRHVHRVREQLLAVETPFGDDVAFLTQANQVKTVLPISMPQTWTFMGESSCARLHPATSELKTTDHPITSMTY